MNLQYRMILDYTARVERLHLGKHPTELTVDVANYIHDDSIDTSIMVKTALRPGLSVNALSLGSVVLVGLPILVLLAAIIILLPRRNL